MGKSYIKYIIVFSSVVLWSSFMIAQPLTAIYPKNGFISGENTINLTWNPFQGSQSYDLKIATDTSFQQTILDTTNVIYNELQFFPQNCATYYWKVRGRSGQVTTSWSKTFTFTIFRPNILNTCKLWLSSNLTDTVPGSKIPLWRDNSGYNNHATQLNASKQPLFTANVLAGLPAIRFDSINDGMQTPLAVNNGRMSVFTVYSYNNLIGKQRRAIQGFSNNYLIGPRSNIFNVYAGNFTGGATVTAFRPAIQRVIQTPTVVKNYINGFLKGSIQNPTYPGILCLGGQGMFPNEVLEGDFFEVIVCDDTLSQENYHLVEKYLDEKYAPPVNLGPDITYTLCDNEISASEGFLTYQWSSGQISRKIEINVTGYYSVTVTDIFGKQSSDSIYAVFHDRKLNLKDTTICAGNFLVLKSLSDEGYNFLWSDNSTSDSLLVTQSGQYSVKIMDSLGCFMFSDTATVHVDDFQSRVTLGNDTALCAGNTIGFQTGGQLISSYLWSNGATDSLLTITTSGSYSVTVTDSNNCIAHDTINIIINGYAPGIDFVVQDQCQGDIVNFEGQVTTNDSIISWKWTFGDGDSAALKNISHFYQQSGEYAVQLHVLALSGCSNTTVKVLKIFPLPQMFLTLDSSCKAIETNFQIEIITFGSDTVSTWYWDFGDGQFSSLQFPVHSYAEAGNYKVNLEVTTEQGCIGTNSDTIKVVGFSKLPSIFQNIYPFDNQIISDSILQFSWSGSGNALSYHLQIASDSLFSSQSLISTHVSSDTFLVCQVPALQNIFWRVLAYNLCKDSLVGGYFHLHSFNPSGLTHLKAWYAADKTGLDLGSKVQTWPDLSGYGMDAINPDLQNQPVLESSPLNNKPTVSFNGISEILQTPLLFSNNEMDIMVVSTLGGKTGPFYLGNTSTNGFGFYRNDTTAYGALFGGVANIKFGNIISKGYQIQELYRAQGATHYLVNDFDGLISNLIPGLPSGQGYVGGVNATLSFRGNISEILCFDSGLSSSDRHYIFNYLHDKYGPPPVELGPSRESHYSLCPTHFKVEDNYETYLWSNGDTSNSTEFQQTGWLKVTVKDLFDVESTDSVYVQYPVHNLKDTVICLGDTVTLSAWVKKGYTYQWESASMGNFSSDSATRVSQAGTYFVTIRDSLGCQIIDSVVIAIDSFAIQAGFGNSTASLCQGEFLGLTSGNNEAVSYLWNNGSTESQILVQSPGIFLVTVADTRGCTATDSLLVTLHGLVPVAQFSAADSVCLGEPVQFTDLSHPAVQDTTASIIEWQWNFGDSVVSQVQHPLHLYQYPGYHSASLVVTTDSGCISSITRDVYIYPLPHSNFLAAYGCTGTAVPFADHSYYPVGKGQGWDWDFGDPASGLLNHSADSATEHIYNLPGSYIVRLIVTSTTGCKDTIYHTVLVQQSPVISFSFSKACVGDSTQFTNTSELPPWSPVLSSEWDFGDGSEVSHGPHPMHLYSSPGIYNVTLTIQTLQCRVSYTSVITVDAKPVAVAGATDLCQATPVVFNDMSTVENGTIAHWFWDLDVLGLSAEANVVLNFADTGTYLIKHSVISDKGCKSDTVNYAIEVFPKPMAGFADTFDITQPSYWVSFTDQSSSDVIVWLWDFGDGITSTQQNPVHQYSQSGNYYITLKVQTVHGCTDESADLVQVSYPLMDIGIIGVHHQMGNGFIQFSADLINLGTRIVSSVDLNLSINGHPAYKERWEGVLYPDSSIQYQFNAASAYDAADLSYYYCIDASFTDGTKDVFPGNNEICKSINNLLTFRDPYPNPVSDFLYLDIILPEEGDLEIDFINSLGQTVGSGRTIHCLNGVNRLSFNTSIINPGLYTLRLIYQGDVHAKRFMKISGF